MRLNWTLLQLLRIMALVSVPPYSGPSTGWWNNLTGKLLPSINNFDLLNSWNCSRWANEFCKFFLKYKRLKRLTHRTGSEWPWIPSEWTACRNEVWMSYYQDDGGGKELPTIFVCIADRGKTTDVFYGDKNTLSQEMNSKISCSK